MFDKVNNFLTSLSSKSDKRRVNKEIGEAFNKIKVLPGWSNVERQDTLKSFLNK